MKKPTRAELIADATRLAMSSITKTGYSRSKWRAIDAGGGEVWALVPFDHPHLGRQMTGAPIGAETKREATAKLREAQRAAIKRLHELKIAGSTASCECERFAHYPASSPELLAVHGQHVDRMVAETLQP